MVLPRLFNATSRTAVQAARSSTRSLATAAKAADGKVRYVFFFLFLTFHVLESQFN